MKKLFALILFVFSLQFVNAQRTGIGNDSAKYVWYKYQYGSRMARAWNDSVFIAPADTTFSKYGWASKGSSIYYGNGSYWTLSSGSSGSSDTVRTLFSPDSSISLTYNTDRDTINAVAQQDLQKVLNKGSSATAENIILSQIDAGTDLRLTLNDASNNNLIQMIAATGNVLLQVQSADAATITQIAPGEVKTDYVGANQFYARDSTQNITFTQGAFYSANPKRVVIDPSGNVGIGTTTPTARLHVVAPDTNVAKLVGLGNTVLATDSALVIDTDGNVKKAAKSSGGGVTTGQLTDSLNARGATYKLKSDSIGNTGYTTLYQRNKLKDSLQTNINLKAPLASPTFTGTLNASGIIASSASAFSTSIRTPVLLGNTTTSGTLTLLSTSGVGATDAIIMRVGNNGGTEALRIINSGNVGIGTTTPTARLHVVGGIITDSIRIGNDWFYTVKLHLTAAQIKTLNSVPIQIIPAPGTGKAIEFISGSLMLNFVSEQFDNGDNITIMVGGGNAIASASVIGQNGNAGSAFTIIEPFEAFKENASFVATSFTDSSTGDSTVDIYLNYRIITL